MKRTRITLARLMAVVAVVAVELAAFIVACRSGEGETASWARTNGACLPDRTFVRRSERRPVACILDGVRRLRLRDDGDFCVGLLFH